MRHRHVRQLAEKGQLDGAEDCLLQASSDYRIAVRAQQNCGAVFQRGRQRVAAFHRANQPRGRINGRAVRRKKFRIHVDRAKAALEHAE